MGRETEARRPGAGRNRVGDLGGLPARLLRNEEVGSSILPGSTTRILRESQYFLRIAETSPRAKNRLVVRQLVLSEG